jgi:hypothetical protein
MAGASLASHDAAMDAMGSVMLAIGAFALLQVVAFNLRGEERHRRRPRTGRQVRPLR